MCLADFARFSVISESATFFYKCDNYYHKLSEEGVHPLDKTNGINWQIPEEKMILSQKDKELQSFESFKSKQI